MSRKDLSRLNVFRVFRTEASHRLITAGIAVMYIVQSDVYMIAIFAPLVGEQFLPKVMSCVGELMASARVSIHPAVQTR